MQINTTPGINFALDVVRIDNKKLNNSFNSKNLYANLMIKNQKTSSILFYPIKLILLTSYKLFLKLCKPTFLL